MASRGYWLSPPTKPIFIISVVLAVLALLVWLDVVNIGIVQRYLFETLLAAYAVLLAGNVFRGL